MSTIPASTIVNVNPTVLPAGGSALDLNGLVLTTSIRPPIGTVPSFASASAVSDYFGPNSAEKGVADVYFAGFENSNRKPGALLFAQYPASAVAAYLRGAPLGMTLAELNAVTAGTLTLTVDGGPFTSASINLSSASSFSNAATLIEAAFTDPTFSVSYDSVTEAFVFTSDTTGASSTITFPTTNAFATALKLTADEGAVTSQGADAAVPATFMDEIVEVTQNWATFMQMTNPDSGSEISVREAFAAWTSLQHSRYAYACWDTSAAAAASAPAAGSLGVAIQDAGYGGTELIWAADTTQGPLKAAFSCSIAASLDFEQTNGRATFAFRRQSGLVADVTTGQAAANLIANGYNFYGVYGAAAEDFTWYQNGAISGDFLWADSYVNQIWFTNELQVALLNLLQNMLSIPYNAAGRGIIEQALADPIAAALNFGAIRAGVTLSSAQRVEINTAAGADVAGVVQTQGWYLQVKDASPATRAARESPPCTLWYTDGQSVQQINLTSVEVQ